MQNQFSRTLRSLDDETQSGRRHYLVLGIAALGLALWTAWLFLAHVTVYETSTTARLEVNRMGSPVDSLIEGRVASMHVTLGQSVHAGDVLVQLDARGIEQALVGARAQREAWRAQRDVRREELLAEQRLGQQQQTRARAAVAVAQARLAQMSASADYARDAAKRYTSLHDKQYVSELEFRETQAQAHQRDSEQVATSREVERELAQRDLDASESTARSLRLRSTLVQLEGDLAKSDADIARLTQDLDQHALRAPRDGKIGELSNVQVGAVVRVAERIATIVPDDDGLRVVAEFEPSAAIGRLRAGQSAKLRVDGFPSLQYGSLPARVTRVASEVRNAHVRVELALSSAPDSLIPQQHGLPGRAEVEVEHTTPWGLVVQRVSAWLGQNETAL